MKILVSWLREFVDVTAAARGARPDAVAARLRAGVDRTRRRSSDGRSTRVRPRRRCVLDFEITANRPDALSVIGLAREAATAYSLPLRQPCRKRASADADSGRRRPSTLEAPDLCPRYAAAVADVTIGPSPAWLRPAAGRRRPAHQQRRRRHQLRAARARPADARVRSRASSRAASCGSAARRRASASRRSTAPIARSIRTCWSSPTPTGRRRSPA